MTSTRRKLTVAGACIVTLVLCSVLAVGWSLVQPAPATVGLPPADFEATAVAITGGSGDSVRGWLTPGRPGAGAVLLLHPIRGNRTSMLGRAQYLHRAGYAVLLVDLQAHGETHGSLITFGAREALDAAAALRFLRERAPGERVGVIGVSLGGAAALLGPGPLPVDAMVLEAVYPTIAEAAENRLRIRLGSIGAALAPALTIQLWAWTGVALADLRPVDAIARLRAPLLLIAGANDPRTTLAESERLFSAAPSPKEIWVVTGAGHDDYHALRKIEYEARVDSFLGRHLRGAR